MSVSCDGDSVDEFGKKGSSMQRSTNVMRKRCAASLEGLVEAKNWEWRRTGLINLLLRIKDDLMS